MIPSDTDAADHPWYLDLRVDPAFEGSDAGAMTALRSLDALGACLMAVHVDPMPSLKQLVAGCGYVGWTIIVPGSVERATIERIAAMAGAGYRVTIAPGHPLPPCTDHVASIDGGDNASTHRPPSSRRTSPVAQPAAAHRAPHLRTVDRGR